MNVYRPVSQAFGKRRVEWRRERMRWMVNALGLPPKARIIDLGGSEDNWHLLDLDYHVTLVNLAGFNPPVSDPSRFVSIEGDACDLSGVFADGAFDAVFSNSVIEHVGDESRQAKFAAEVHRLGQAYWVQTPSNRFPIEVHTAIPYYWKLPNGVRKRILDNMHPRYPVWVDMLRETRVLSRRRMAELFPDAQVKSEYYLGLEKSYSFYKPYPRPEGQLSEVAGSGRLAENGQRDLAG